VRVTTSATCEPARDYLVCSFMRPTGGMAGHSADQWELRHVRMVLGLLRRRGRLPPHPPVGFGIFPRQNQFTPAASSGALEALITEAAYDAATPAPRGRPNRSFEPHTVAVRTRVKDPGAFTFSPPTAEG